MSFAVRFSRSDGTGGGVSSTRGWVSVGGGGWEPVGGGGWEPVGGGGRAPVGVSLLDGGVLSGGVSLSVGGVDAGGTSVGGVVGALPDTATCAEADTPFAVRAVMVAVPAETPVTSTCAP